MKTKLLNFSQIDEAVSLLKSGNIIALPTETVYGLAADASNDEAIKKIFIAKNRPTNHPLIVHIESFTKVKEWAEEIPEIAIDLAKSFWPGSLTMLFNKKATVSNVITGSSSKIALRIPNHHLMLEVINKLGKAVVAPSANSFKKLSPTRAEHVLNDLSGKISAVLDGGQCNVGIESTIIDVTSNIPQILRPGAITKEMIEIATKSNIQAYETHIEQVPGNVAAHYQPNTPVMLLSLSEIENFLNITPKHNVAIVHFSNLNRALAKSYKMPTSRVDYARDIYDALHKVDLLKADRILIESPPRDWTEVNDRLSKAAHYNS